MQQDEDEIRQLVTDWMAASKAGDTEAVLKMMSDDVVFLMPGRLPMDKDEFAAASRIPPGQQAPLFDGKSEIQEIQVCGDWAWMWTRLSVSVTMPGAPAPMQRAGYTLTILKKQGGRWVIARDANMLAPVPKSPA